MERELLQTHIIKLLEEDKWFYAAIEAAKLFKYHRNDYEIRATCSLIWMQMLSEDNKFEPLTSEEFMWRGIVGRSERGFFETLRDFGTAILLDQENDFALRCRAKLFMDFNAEDLLQKAKEDFIKAIDLNPNPEYCHELAEVYFRLGDYESSLFYIFKAVGFLDFSIPEHQERDAIYYFNAGINYWNLNKINEAKIMFMKTLEVYPEQADACEYIREISIFPKRNNYGLRTTFLH